MSAARLENQEQILVGPALHGQPAAIRVPHDSASELRAFYAAWRSELAA
jgi:hypothetical protein